MTEVQVYIVCGFKDHPPIAAAKGETYVDATCDCGAALLKRRSAPEQLKPICMTCWSKQ